MTKTKKLKVYYNQVTDKECPCIEIDANYYWLWDTNHKCVKRLNKSRISEKEAIEYFNHNAEYL